MVSCADTGVPSTSSASALSHRARIVPLLVLRQRSVTIAVDVRDDRLGHGDPRRQVQLELHTTRIDGQSRGLKILIPSMRRHLRDGDDGRRQGQDAGGTATSW